MGSYNMTGNTVGGFGNSSFMSGLTNAPAAITGGMQAGMNMKSALDRYQMQQALNPIAFQNAHGQQQNAVGQNQIDHTKIAEQLAAQFAENNIHNGTVGSTLGGQGVDNQTATVNNITDYAQQMGLTAGNKVAMDVSSPDAAGNNIAQVLGLQTATPYVQGIHSDGTPLFGPNIANNPAYQGANNMQDVGNIYLRQIFGY